MSNYPLCNSGECSGGRGGNADCMNKNSKIWPKPFMPNHPAWDSPSNLQIGQLNLADYKARNPARKREQQYVAKRHLENEMKEQTYLCRHCLTLNNESELVKHKKVKGYDRSITDNIRACKSCMTGVFYS